jgi:hypothetical protein
MFGCQQQHAVETLVYLYEIAQVRRQKQLIDTFAHRQDLTLLQYDDFARYCVKMATGSGKTGQRFSVRRRAAMCRSPGKTLARVTSPSGQELGGFAGTGWLGGPVASTGAGPGRSGASAKKS